MLSLQRSYGLAVAITLVGSCLAQPGTVRLSAQRAVAGISGFNLGANDRWPYQYWDGPYLVEYTYLGDPQTPAIRVHDQAGNIKDVVVWFAGAKQVLIHSVSITRQGTLYVAGNTTGATGQVAGFVGEVGSSGRLGRVVRTSPYASWFACSTGDGTVWTFGVEMVNGEVAPYDHDLLRHYDLSKGLIAGALKSSALARTASAPLQGRYPGQTNMRCTPNRVVVYNGPTDQLIEYDVVNGRLVVTQVAPLPQSKATFRWTGFAVADNGDIFASFLDRRSTPFSAGLFLLQAGSGGAAAQWIPVSGTVGPTENGIFYRLLGGDGTNIAYMPDWKASTLTLARVEH